MKTHLLFLLLSVSAFACGREEDRGHAITYLPVCCDGKVAASPEAVLMCKTDASGQVSSVFVERAASGMIDTMREMEYLTCQ